MSEHIDESFFERIQHNAAKGRIGITVGAITTAENVNMYAHLHNRPFDEKEYIQVAIDALEARKKELLCLTNI